MAGFMHYSNSKSNHTVVGGMRQAASGLAMNARNSNSFHAFNFARTIKKEICVLLPDSSLKITR